MVFKKYIFIHKSLKIIIMKIIYWPEQLCPKLKFLQNFIEIFPNFLRYSTLFTILLTNIWSEDGMFTTYRMPCVNLNQIIYFSTFSYKIWRMGRRNWWCWPGDASPLLSALLLYSMLLWMVKGGSKIFLFY